MFYLVRQSFWQLGILVILLAVGFSLLFYLLKNLIDRLDRQRMYGAGVVLYTVSWLLRGRINGEMVAAELYMLLIMVKVGTSLFRLAFNKRFFDIARVSGGYRYILCKNYFSQFFLALFFGILGLLTPQQIGTESFIRMSYWAAACMAPIYLVYREAVVRQPTDRVLTGLQR